MARFRRWNAVADNRRWGRTASRSTLSRNSWSTNEPTSPIGGLPAEGLDEDPSERDGVRPIVGVCRS